MAKDKIKPRPVYSATDEEARLRITDLETKVDVTISNINSKMQLLKATYKAGVVVVEFQLNVSTSFATGEHLGDIDIAYAPSTDTRGVVGSDNQSRAIRVNADGTITLSDVAFTSNGNVAMSGQIIYCI